MPRFVLKQTFSWRCTIVASLFWIAGGLLGTMPAHAQQGREIGLISRMPDKEKRFALIIGVDNYEDDGITKLKGADNDARELARALREYSGFARDNIFLLTTDAKPRDQQPTSVNIMEQLANLRGLVPADGLLLISFSGHGIERDGKAYLIPSDAILSKNIEVFTRRAISVEDIKKQVRAIGVGQVLILLDACRNDPTTGKGTGDNLMARAFADDFSFNVKNREVQAFATIYATAVGTRAYETSTDNGQRQGFFSLAVVEGLSGEAANEQGEVTLGRLVDYVQARVPQRVRRKLGDTEQKPFAIIEGFQADRLILAKTGNSETPTPRPSAPSADALANVPPTAERDAEAKRFLQEARNSFNEGDYVKAIANYTRVLDIQPRHHLAFGGRAWAYFKQGQAEAALRDYAQALAIEPDAFLFYEQRAKIYDALGHSAKAAADRQKAAEIRGRN